MFFKNFCEQYLDKLQDESREKTRNILWSSLKEIPVENLIEVSGGTQREIWIKKKQRWKATLKSKGEISEEASKGIPQRTLEEFLRKFMEIF